MDKSEHINYWITSSIEDWDTATALLSSKRYLHALFFAHLSLEKICKALWVKSNEDNFPPKIHNLVRILKDTNIKLEINDKTFLEEFNDFQLEGRYPDYLFIIHTKCNLEFTKSLFEKVQEIREWLLKKLQ